MDARNAVEVELQRRSRKLLEVMPAAVIRAPDRRWLRFVAGA
jgi:hypothetical protein